MCELRVGMVLTGFCGGYFGRDAYGDKTIEALGADWIVARLNGSPIFAEFDSIKEMERNIIEWLEQEELDV